LSRPLFLYGTLLDAGMLERMAGQKGLALRLRPARLEGFVRVHLRGTPYPCLVPGAGAVKGALLRVSGAALAKLAAYEGPPYALRPLRVMGPRGPVWARAWVVPRWRADAIPWPPLGPHPLAMFQ
jgi:gamma-glutamylcyclotransferase (GGCT)/AIG2-like uncharacterized protein YtfP